MLWRDNRGENPSADEKEIEVKSQGETVQKAFSDVQDLKAKIEALKAQTENIADSIPEGTGDFAAPGTQAGPAQAAGGSAGAEAAQVSSDEVRAAELAVLQQAMRDAEERQAVYEDRMEKNARIKVAEIRQKEAQERAAQKQKEALEKKKALEEAEAREAEVKKQRQMAELQAELNRSKRSQMHAEALEKKNSSEQKLKEIQQQKEQIEQERIRREELQRQLQKEKEEELRRQEERERRIQEEKRRKQEEKRLAAIRKKQEEEEKRRIAAEAKARKEAERKAREELKRAERERLIEEQRAIQQRKRELKAEERRIREEADRKVEEAKIAKRKADEAVKLAKKRAEEATKLARKKADEISKRAAAEADAVAKQARQERSVRKAELKAERARRREIRKRKDFARKAADMGGGIVAIHGTTVQTEIQPVPAFSLRDFFGMSKRKEIKEAGRSKEREELIAESERIKNEARATAAQLAEARRERRKNSALYGRIVKIHGFFREKSKPLLVAFSVVLMLAVGIAGVFNYMTAYEYSYNGVSLGYVKSKDDVLQITEMVQTALSEEKGLNVVIDASDDIQFKRVPTFNKDVAIDSQEDILKRLTYMGDVNIKSYGIYINGKKAGAVSSKKTAGYVLQDMKDKYSSKAEGSEIEKAEIVENIEVKPSKTPMKDVLSREQMVEKLSTDSVKEVVYTVQRGDTLESIAETHGVTAEEILEDNENVDSKTLEVGSTIILHEVSPLMTVRLTEVRDYEKKTEYKTIKKKDKELYEGYTEVDQKGQKGVSEVVDRTVSVNGEVVETENLKTDVKKEPVDKIVRIGTKERPPTVGSGTYIWPANPGTYVVTSEFKWRWGRQHQGMDMGCATGNDVLASDGGTVVHAGWMGGYGNLVIIDHQNGIKTYYAHNSSLCVRVGDKVFQGQHIAEAGNTGNSFGSHIHFGVMDHGTFKNPRNYLP